MPLRDWRTPTVLRRGETLQLRVGALDTKRWQMYVGNAAFLPKGRTEDPVRITEPARLIVKYLVTGPRGAIGRNTSFPHDRPRVTTAASRRP